MTDLNPAYVDGLKNILEKSPYFALLNMQLVELAPGRALFRVPAEPKHTGTFDQVHGGVYASIIDAATFWALFSEIPEENPMTTMELKINYLASTIAHKTLMVEGRTIKLGRTIGLAEADIIEADTGRKVGFGTSTCMILPPPLLEPLSSLPRKYLK